MLSEILRQLRTVPEYIMALKGALAVLAMGVPLYAGLRYFLYRRQLSSPLSLTLGFVSVFVLFAGMTFLLASPLASIVVGGFMTAYLFLTCILTALTIVGLIDLFLIQHYLSHVKRMYISPPMRTVIKLGIFCLSLLPILHYVLHFNPLALVAIPTIASAGIAFALQDTLKAFIAGVGLGHIVRLGEWIAFQDKEGCVIDISWTRTTLETRDGQRVFIPNNLLLSGVFLNYTTGNPASRQCVKVGVSYDSTPIRVKDTLLSCAQGVAGVSSHPPPQANLLEYADSAVVYGLFYWLEDYTRRQTIQDEVATRVWYALRREGISIPYPTRTLQIQRPKDTAAESSERINSCLHQWNLAEAFFAEELQELSRWARLRTYAPGESIVTQGELGSSLFVVVEGTVEVFVAPENVHPVAALGHGDIFGEMSLLTGEARSAAVRARNLVEVIEVEKTGLQSVIAKRPDLSERLAELVVKRRRANAALPVSGQPPASGMEDDHSLSRRIRQFFGLAWK